MISITQIAFQGVKPSNKVFFRGSIDLTKNSKSTYLLAFDLDGTFLKCDKKSMERFLEISKQKNVKLAYVSGRVLSELDKIIKTYEDKGIKIPMPDYFITNSGQYLFENKNGKMLISEEYYDRLVNSGFNKQKTLKKMKKLIKNTSINGQPTLMQFDYRKCDLNIEYLVGAKIKSQIKSKLEKFMKDNNITAKIIYDYVPPRDIELTLPMFPKEIQKQIKPLLDKDGGLLTFYMCAANKADAVDFLRNKLKLDRNHVITAGNAGNDISLAKSGFWFIMVNNAQQILKELIKSLSSQIKEKIIKASKDGTAGINEALEQIFSRVGFV